LQEPFFIALAQALASETLGEEIRMAAGLRIKTALSAQVQVRTDRLSKLVMATQEVPEFFLTHLVPSPPPHSPSHLRAQHLGWSEQSAGRASLLPLAP